MFEPTKSRYMTRGFAVTIPLRVQYALWNMINDIPEKVEKDYLQVFRLQVTEDGITVTQHQEVPEYRKTIKLKRVDSAHFEDCKVFIIDDGARVTAMLAEEY